MNKQSIDRSSPVILLSADLLFVLAFGDQSHKPAALWILPKPREIQESHSDIYKDFIFSHVCLGKYQLFHLETNKSPTMSSNAQATSRVTRDGRNLKRKQAEEWMTEYKKLEQKKQRSQKEERRLDELRKRLSDLNLQENKEDQEGVSAEDSSPAYDGMEGVEYSRPSDPRSSYSQDDNASNENNESPSEEQEFQQADKNETTGIGEFSRGSRQRTAPKAQPSPAATEAGGIAEGYTECNSWKGHTRIIYRFGPPDQAKWEIGGANKHTDEQLKGLDLISGKNKSIMDILVDGRPIYGFRNIQSIAKVATLTPNPNKRSRKPRPTKSGKPRNPRFPTTYVGILWDGIREEHQHMLEDGKSWNLRSKLMGGLKAKEKRRLDEWIRDAAKTQDWRYEAWRADNDSLSPKRPPTFFPEIGGPSNPSKTHSKSQQAAENRRESSTNADLNSNPRGPQQEGNHRQSSSGSSKRKTRSDSVPAEQDPEPPKKSKEMPKPINGKFDYDSYKFTLMSHYGATQELLQKDHKKYQEIMRSIEDEWPSYRENMKNQGYQELQKGGSA